MSAEGAPKRLQQFLELYERSCFTSGEAQLQLFELAALMEVDQLLAKLPEELRRDLQQRASQPLVPRHEWSSVIGGTIVYEESHLRERKAREDRQYAGLKRLHEHFSKH